MDRLSVAALMFGLPGGRRGQGGEGGWLDPKISFQNYKQVLFRDVEVDFFCHTWETSASETIRSTYSPVRFESSPPLASPLFDVGQAPFSNVVQFVSEKPLKISPRELRSTAYRASSRWLSTARVAKMYAEDVRVHGLTHDWLVLLRYDLFFLSPLDLASMPTSCSVAVGNRPPDPRTGERGPIDDLFVAFKPEVLRLFLDVDQNLSRYALNPREALVQRLVEEGLELQPSLSQKNDYFLLRDLMQSFLSTRGRALWLLSFLSRFLKGDFKTVRRLISSFQKHRFGRRQLGVQREGLRARS